jgi:hypothetical protein
MNNTISREEDEEFERMVRRMDWAEHILPKCPLKSIDEPPSVWVELTNDEVFEIANFCKGQDIFALAKELSRALKDRNK